MICRAGKEWMIISVIIGHTIPKCANKEKRG
jgi:hypothetical protein